MTPTRAVGVAPSLRSPVYRKDLIVIQLIADLFSTGVLDTLSNVIDIISWEE